METATQKVKETAVFEVEQKQLEEFGESVSFGLIAEKGAIKKPFAYRGKNYVGTAGASNGVAGQLSVEAYEVVPEAEWDAETITYSQARRDAPLGTYHSLKVKQGKGFYVLVGPKVEFIHKQKKSREEVETILDDPKPKTVVESCICVLSSSEVLERNRSLTSAMNKRDAEISRFSAERDKHKMNLKMIESDIQKFRSACDTGKEWRDLECTEEFDFEKAVVRVRRPDTFEVIRTRSMTTKELQKSLPLRRSNITEFPVYREGRQTKWQRKLSASRIITPAGSVIRNGDAMRSGGSLAD